MLDPGDYDGTYEADAGHLALDFANTVSNRLDDRRHDWLDSYSNLLAWGELVGTLSDDNSRILLREAGRDPELAAKALERAIQLREAVYRIFSAVAGGRAPENDAVGVLNHFLTEALAHIRVVPEAGVFHWQWMGSEDALDRVCWPVARAAAELLTSDEIGRVGECLGDGCGWLFQDMSRNRSRRWCSMAECGNRAKARRHYARRGKVT